ncbi:CBS domain-containing protein [Sulfurimonas sp.]|uniref:CBS domain-containing protein n=1 Tax=Sulfurimonas sp. TaxID=2022749 RepID=UPI002B46CDF4|nr:CBS domain-containing protein [Sulfurimonas sp.]
MNSKFIIDSNASILSAMQKIDVNKESFLLCINKGGLLDGTLTDGDIRRYIVKSKNLDANVADVMSKNFESLDTDDTFRDIAEKFKSRKIQFLPILKNKKLKNILTKKQFHIMLLEDMKIDLLKDFSLYDEKNLEHEIYNKPWGFYKSTLFTELAQSKVITVFPNEELSLQEHKKREEHWVIIKGKAKVVLGDSELLLNAGKYVYIPKGVKHQIVNLSKNENLIFAEVQLGEYFGEDDIIRYKDKYNRI